MALALCWCLALLVSVNAWNKHMENPSAYQGDMILTPEQLAAVKDGTFSYGSVTYGKWPGAKVPYQIEGSLGSSGRQAIEGAIAEYHRATCIRFVPKGAADRGYISFFAGTGCNSPVGMQNGGNRISLGDGCQNRGTVLHEIGHSLGLFHEQSRPDRDKFVTINWGAISAGMAFNFHIQNNINSLGTPYDLASMMHYSSTAFATGRTRTITTIDASKQSIIDTNNRISGFSPIDIQQINLMYQCSGGGTLPTQAPPPPNCPDNNANCAYWASIGECAKNPNYMLVNCKKSCKQC